MSPLRSHATYNLAPTRLNPARSASLPIGARKRLRRLTTRDSLIQITELRTNQAAIIDRCHISLIAIDPSDQLPRHNLDVGERALARVLLLAVAARAVQFADVLSVEILHSYGALGVCQYRVYLVF